MSKAQHDGETSEIRVLLFIGKLLSDIVTL